jgi:predicted GTPase
MKMSEGTQNLQIEALSRMLLIAIKLAARIMLREKTHGSSSGPSKRTSEIIALNAETIKTILDSIKTVCYNEAMIKMSRDIDSPVVTLAQTLATDVRKKN